MPRFMVERDFQRISDEEMDEAVALSRNSIGEHFPELEWKYSHVCQTDEGEIKAFCVYSAPSAERLSEHVVSMGGQVKHRLYEILEEEHAQVRNRA